MTDQILAFLIPLAAVLASVLTFFATRHNTSRQERADVLAGYAQLANDLRLLIGLNNEELARLRQEIAELKTRYEIDREEWRLDREALQARINDLEIIKERLGQQLEITEAKADRKGA